MPHVSKKRLEKKLFLSLYNQFTSTVSIQSKRKQAMLGDLLTKTEKIMLAKRLAAVFMLLENASLYNIENTLNISASTAARFARNLDNGEYAHIENFFGVKKKKKEFWETLEKIVRVGMPPMGRGRWRWLYEMDDKYQ